MTMNKVLIADDEPSVIQSLLSSVEWERNQLIVQATASDGVEVLSILEKEKIDIAILDIRMPGLSGLELCRLLHKRQSHIQIIIISGYAEFSYAQEAIQYGVLGYCLKPVDYIELTTLLLKAKNNLNSLYNENLVDELAESINTDDRHSILTILEHAGFGEEKVYVAVSIGETPLSNIKTEPQSLSLKLARNQYLYILHKPLADLSPAAELNSNSVHIGLLNQPVSKGDLQNAYASCLAIAYQFFIHPQEFIFVSMPDDNTCCPYFDELSRALTFSNKEQVIRLLHKYRDKQCVKSFNIRTSLQLCNLIFFSKFFKEKNDYYIYSFQQLVSEFTTFDNMLRRLEELINAAEKCISFPASHNNSVFLKLMDYINTHYKGDISLPAAANAMCMNPNYISQMFKRETGITFIHYITDLRINEAKLLLTSTNMSISDISIKVGYNDYFYFLKIFKKVTGKTPSQWRQG